MIKKEEGRKSIYHYLKLSYAIYVLIILCLINIIRTAQRGFLSIVAQPVQRELKIKDDLFGAINGPIFSIFFSISGLLFGRILDLYSRRGCIMIMLFIISCATSAHGFLTKSWHLIIVRIMFAIGISGMTSVTLSLISDYFDEKSRALTIGVWNLTAYFGAGLVFAMGGLLNESGSNWRTIFLYFGIPTFLIIPIIWFTVEEPERGALDKYSNVRVPSLFESFQYILGNISLFCLCFFAGSSYAVINSQQVWYASFFQRVHNLSPFEISKYLSWITPVGGITGTLLGGYLADKLPQYSKRWYAVILFISVFTSLIFQSLIFLVPNYLVSLILTFFATFFTLFGIPAFYVLSINLVPVSLKAISVSWMNLFLSLIGSFGPLIVGVLNRWNAPYFDGKDNPLAIRWSLFITCSGAFTISIIASFIMFFFLPREFQRLEEWNLKLSKDNDQLVNNEKIQ